jgi:O-antigen ligase
LNPAINRIFVFFFAALFLTTLGFAAYLQEVRIIAIPFALLGALMLIQWPEYLFYLLMFSIPWSMEFNFTPSLGTDLPDEPLMLLSSLAILIYFIYRRKTLRWQRPHWLVVLLLIQLLWTAITVVVSTDIILSTKYLLAKGWYLLAFVGLPLALFHDEKIFRRSVLLLLFSMLGFMAVTMVRHWQYNWTFEKINDALAPFYRNHVNYSALLVFMVPLQIAVTRLATSKIIRVLMILLLMTTLVALYFSYSRGAWLALITGIITYWLLRRRLLLFGFFAFISLAIGTVIWLKTNERYIKFSNDYKSTIFHSDFSEHLVATYQLKDMSNAERVYRWVAGVRMLPDSWKTGFGPSTFYHQYKSYAIPAFKTYVSNNPEQSTVHNYFLLLFIEQGMIGFFLFVALLAFLFLYAQRVYHRTQDKFWRVVVAAVASILVMECTVNFLSDMIETDKVGSIFYLCLATLIIADEKTRRRFRSSREH